MKIFIRIILILIVIIIGTISSIVYLPAGSNDEILNIEKTPERLDRGEYLVHHVTGCLDCHSKRIRDYVTLFEDEKSWGANAEMFGKEHGFPGDFYPSNLTPSNLEDWTDREIYNAIVTGVNKDGRVLFPVMPYGHYNKMSREDVYSIIAYIRTLKPIETNDPESKPSTMIKIISKLFFKKQPEHREIPAKSDKVAYGEYIVNAASCYDCHTPRKKGRFIEEMGYAGGFEFKSKQGSVYSANITPDKETGIGTWDEEYFLNQFTQWRDPEMKYKKKAPGTKGSEMPWSLYAGMSDEDIRAMYAYLKTVNAVNNKVDTEVTK